MDSIIWTVKLVNTTISTFLGQLVVTFDVVKVKTDGYR